MFMPFGIMFPMLYKKRFKLFITTVTAALCSLLIETTQYFFTVDRAADIDDFILNIIGAILGYLVFLLIIKWKKKYPIKFFIFNPNKR